MTKHRHTAGLAAALIATAACSAIWIYQTRETSGQQGTPQPNRRPACTCFCGDGSPASFNLFPNADAKAGKCYGGPLPADACRTSFGGLPPGQQKAVCARIQATNPKCPKVKALCGDAPPAKCEKPTPWFGPQTGCRDVQDARAAVTQSSVTLSVCGKVVFSNPFAPSEPRANMQGYAALLESEARARMGKICCDQFLKAVQTGSPCDPSSDLDCDGKPNFSDTYSSAGQMWPQIDLYPSSPAVADRPFDSSAGAPTEKFVPPADKCDCKWLLVTGTRTCSPDGVRPHVYQARWRCGSTGNERFTRQEVPATGACTAASPAAALDLCPVGPFAFMPPRPEYGVY